jgi:hypothetical protein
VLSDRSFSLRFGSPVPSHNYKLAESVPYVPREERSGLHAYRYSQFSDNPHCMNLLLDFIEEEFGLLPVESDGESLVFMPPFVALVGVALRDTSIWVSLYGSENDFDGKDLTAGKYAGWRSFHVQCRDPDVLRAKELIRRACENYRRQHPGQTWDEMVGNAEKRWLHKRNNDVRRDLFRSLMGW